MFSANQTSAQKNLCTFKVRLSLSEISNRNNDLARILKNLTHLVHRLSTIHTGDFSGTAAGVTGEPNAFCVSSFHTATRSLSAAIARGPVPSAYIGSPITTSMVPGFLAQPSFGQYLPALCATGSTGSSALTAIADPLRENLPIWP